MAINSTAVLGQSRNPWYGYLAGLPLATTPRNDRRLAFQWFHRRYVLAFCLGPSVVVLISSFFLPISISTLIAQLALGGSTLFSLWLLSDRPFLNPIQAFVLLFHWWFAMGPAVCALFYWAAGNTFVMESYLPDDPTAVLIVAAGLPLYAVLARFTTSIFARIRWQANCLCPSGWSYKFRTILIMVLTAGVAELVLAIFSFIGIRAYDSTNYLGGQSTASTPLAVVASIVPLVNFALLGLFIYLILPNMRQKTWHFKALALGILVISIGSALTSGYKGLIIQPLFWAIASYITWRQRIPWLAIGAAVVAYLVFVEPFVATTRIAAQKAAIVTNEQREEFFRESLANFSPGNMSWRSLNLESPFRGVYPHAIRIAADSDWLSGPWQGESLRNGMSAVIPRALAPNKADSNMAHYFALELGEADIYSPFHSIAISVPFECVGNYGWLAGIFSFGVIGIVWGGFITFLLTPDRLSTHPLMPYCLTLLLAFEQSVGQFLNAAKLLVFPLAVIGVVWAIFGKDL